MLGKACNILDRKISQWLFAIESKVFQSFHANYRSVYYIKFKTESIQNKKGGTVDIANKLFCHTMDHQNGCSKIY